MAVVPPTAVADSLFPLTRTQSTEPTFSIAGCGEAATRTIRVPARAYALDVLRPQIGTTIRDESFGEVFGRVDVIRVVSGGARPAASITAVGSEAACRGQTDEERVDCEEFGESCAISGRSDPVRVVVRFTRREKVYVTGSGRGGPRSYKPRVLPFGMRSAIVGVRWRQWGSARAVGHGRVEFNNCVPDCARARPSYYPVRAELTARRECNGFVQYLALRFRYTTAARPPGLPSSYRERFGWQCR